jgi:preprotein translocase subunit SecG
VLAVRNQAIYNVILGITLLVALALILLIQFTSKGDAMSGGGQIRTTFKGRATVDDQIAKLTIYLVGGFVALMITLDVLA